MLMFFSSEVLGSRLLLILKGKCSTLLAGIPGINDKVKKLSLSLKSFTT